MLWAISPGSPTRFGHIAADLVVVTVCSFTAAAILLEISLISLMMLLICAMASTALAGIVLNRFDLLVSISSVARGGFLSQFLHLVGHHGETFAGLTRAGRFDRHIQSEQVGLLRDAE